MRGDKTIPFDQSVEHSLLIQVNVARNHNQPQVDFPTYIVLMVKTGDFLMVTDLRRGLLQNRVDGRKISLDTISW